MKDDPREGEEANQSLLGHDTEPGVMGIRQLLESAGRGEVMNLAASLSSPCPVHG
jgi:hypothetical protein